MTQRTDKISVLSRRQLLKAASGTAALLAADKLNFPAGAFAQAAGPEVKGAKLGFIAQRLPGISAAALDVIAMHHELLDGSGYPGKREGEQIGRLARIACIANAFDNYCNRTNPADSMTPAEAVSFMFRKEPRKYDPVQLHLFVRCMGVYPPGSVVQLNNGQLGFVMSVNPGRLLHPSLLLYDPDVPKEEALWLDMREAPELSVVKTLRPAELDVAVLAYLDPRTRVSYFTENSLSGNRAV